MNAASARSFCKSFGSLDLGSFDTRDEFLVIKSKLEAAMSEKSIFVIVGGFARETSNRLKEYHWISSGLKIFSDLQPNNNNSCLGIKKEAKKPTAFVAISCQDELEFVCEEVELKYEN